MTIHYVEAAHKVRDTITCNRCDHVASYQDGCEAQDFLSFRDTGGYASVHMDGQRWYIDLCGPCTIEVLGEWIIKDGERR